MATAAATGPQAAAPTPQQHQPYPIYDLFLDVPHPAASNSCPPLLLIKAENSDVEEELSKSVPQVARFAFPEYFESQDVVQARNNVDFNKFDLYAMQPVAFQMYTFSLQLQSGVRVHGHVRRYLPSHNVGKGRFDVGRRGERALVILTRATGADPLYSSILKTVEALSAQQKSVPERMLTHKQPHEWFLHQFNRIHQQLSATFAATPQEKRSDTICLTIRGLEFGCYKKFSQVDTSHFFIPSCILQRLEAGNLASFSSSSILPLLRCLGVSNSLRLLSALLSERRIILISSSTTRLAASCKAAISMLAQGMLHWQHIYIPVLPPHLWQYLAAPMPYIIGILSSMSPRLDHTDGLSEVLIINLDQNAMETRGMAPTAIQRRIPDLFLNAQGQQQFSEYYQQSAPASAADFLAQDLVELLKNDKKVLYGETTFANVANAAGEQAVKATKAIKSTFSKLKRKGQKYLEQQRSGVSDTSDKSSDNGYEDQLDSNETVDTNKMAPDYIYTEACRNEIGEEEARVAFALFFLCMFGDMRWYLSGTQGQMPQLDKQKFLQHKRNMGDGDDTPMGLLLQNFCHTQMLEEFVKARLEETVARRPVLPNAPLFLRCVNYHRAHRIDFNVNMVRHYSRQVAQSAPSKLLAQTSARRDAMALTSKKTYEGNYEKAVADLVEKCRESSYYLFDVMCVIWMRLRDCKGMNWKHAYCSLMLLRNLLYHGPVSVVAEASDGLGKIRILKFYNDTMRSQNCQQVKVIAACVYNLLIDRSNLFAIRRVCADRRRVLRKGDQGRFPRLNNVNVNVPFQTIHSMLRPNAMSLHPASNVPISQLNSSAVPNQYAGSSGGFVSGQSSTPTQTALSSNTGGELLGLTNKTVSSSLNSSAPNANATPINGDIFGLLSNAQQNSNQPAAPKSDDLFDIFKGMTLSSEGATSSSNQVSGTAEISPTKQDTQSVASTGNQEHALSQTTNPQSNQQPGIVPSSSQQNQQQLLQTQTAGASQQSAHMQQQQMQYPSTAQGLGQPTGIHSYGQQATGGYTHQQQVNNISPQSQQLPNPAYQQQQHANPAYQQQAYATNPAYQQQQHSNPAYQQQQQSANPAYQQHPSYPAYHQQQQANPPYQQQQAFYAQPAAQHTPQAQQSQQQSR